LVKLPEYEENRSGQTASGPEIIPIETCAHVKDSKWDEDRQRDDFLQNLQLRQVELAIADPVGRHLEQVFKECDPPTDSHGNQPMPGSQVLQMAYQAKVMNTLDMTSKTIVLI
jgi:hypothetical protein